MTTRINSYHLDQTITWDLIIIGGGATGLGTAVDAASRGLKTLLLEQSDFAKGTSSRSTKLVHGGVRYLAQGDIGLVKHALEERGLMEKNAAHLVHKEEFIIPCYSWFDVAKYFAGLTFYDLLAGRYSFGKSKYLSKSKVMNLLPGVKTAGLKGGISYYDGKFDDARLALNLAQTAIEQGATVLNYVKVSDLIKKESRVVGLCATDRLTGECFNLKANMVINATGVFVDDILQMNNPKAKPLVRPSQGVHLVLDSSFLPGNSALMIPKTSDGRVLFAVPWHEHLLIGTTDTPLDQHSLEPRALKKEIDFILATAAAYLTKKPEEKDILSVFSGLRPLAAPTDPGKGSTKEISRDHKLMVSTAGLITITGGKWTTYRRMAEETVDLAVKEAKLMASPCITKTLKIHGCEQNSGDHHLQAYGTDQKYIESIANESAQWREKLHPDYPYIAAEIKWIVEHELVETLEDVLSRRLRMLLINAKAAMEMAPQTASIMATLLAKDQRWEQTQLENFKAIAEGYLYSKESEPAIILA